MMHIYANALMKTVFKLMKKEEDTLNLIKAYCKLKWFCFANL